MEGMTRVLQRIATIEQRFRQPTPHYGFGTVMNGAMQSSDSNTLSAASSDDISRMIHLAANRHGVDPKLAMAVAKVESNLSPHARSPVGAVGVMQLMPDTARSLGVRDPLNPSENIDGGVRYLKQMLGTFHGDTKKALAAYNAGPAAVQHYNGVPPYSETQDYVVKVLQLYRQ